MVSISDLEMGPSPSKRARWEEECLGFLGKDIEGIIQPHDDALVAILRIAGFDVRRVMIDQGSGFEVMYPNLYEGLGLTPKDLTQYDTPLVAIDDTMVTPVGEMRLVVKIGGRKELVDFIVVHSYSPYTAILGCPWIHFMGVVTSSLHQKVKFPTDQGIFQASGRL